MSKVPAGQYTLEYLDSIRDVGEKDWNALAGADYPFLRHQFLLALEDSGATNAASGWQPCHLLLRRGGELRALLPLYLKNHSYGEYVFDWAWADAYRRHGLEYYPKLLSAVPFTPCAGPRLCIHPAADREEILRLVAEALPRRAREVGASGWHLLFPEEELSASLAALGLGRRVGCQYQWFNRGYSDFEDFLETFSSRKRKNLRKERRRLEESGIAFELLEGPDIGEQEWRLFFRFYQSTYFVRGRQPYLNLDFFQRIGRSMPESLLLVLARQGGETIAGALSFKGADTLYGRYWGCSEEYEFLHFETCYYRGIDYCIDKGLRRFDSGAQGEHKIQRGFEPVRTWSNHWLAHPQFNRAIGEFLAEEERYVGEYIAQASDFLPFKKEG